MPPTSLAHSPSYLRRRDWITRYFDRTASRQWEALTSDAPVGRVRQTVREGRERMAAQLLSFLPDDLRGWRVLDAGCGTGTLSLAMARRGADVVGVDVAPSLLAVAQQRLQQCEGPGTVQFLAGDMLDPTLGVFDAVVAMDSLIHYGREDFVRGVTALVQRARRDVLLTFAPSTFPLRVMHAVGRMVPRGPHRAPAIQPLAEAFVREAVRTSPGLELWRMAEMRRISAGFYTSQAVWLQCTASQSNALEEHGT
jgi:magnesium-protoporphyrin O-methyltransferase